MNGDLMPPDDNDDNTLGRNVRRLREAAGLTQAQLAARIGVTGQSVWNVEKGHSFPRPSLMHRIAEALGVERHDLLRPPLERVPSQIVEMAALAAAAGMPEPSRDEVDELLAIQLPRRPTPQAYLFLLMALRALERE